MMSAGQGLGEAEQKLLGAKGDVQAEEIKLAAVETKLAAMETKLVAAKKELTAAKEELADVQKKWMDAKEASVKTHYFRVMDFAKNEVNTAQKAVDTAQKAVYTAQKAVDHYQAKLFSLDSDHSNGKESARVCELLKSTFSLKRQTPIRFDRELIALEPSLTRASK